SLQPAPVLDQQRFVEPVKRPSLIDDLRRKKLVSAALLLFDVYSCGIARSEMNDEIRNNRNAEQRWKDQEKTFQEIASHCLCTPEACQEIGRGLSERERAATPGCLKLKTPAP